MAEPAIAEVRLIGLPPLPEVQPGDDLSEMIAQSITDSGLGIEAGDVLVVTHKIVSQSEGQTGRAAVPSSRRRWRITSRSQYGKDARQVEVVLRESERIVRMDRGVIIAETGHGLSAPMPASMPPMPPKTVCLLPVDPDASAAATAG